MIVVGGEALVDLVPEKSIVDETLPALKPRLGGGPYNVAVALGRLDVPVSFISRISTDLYGEALVDRLRNSGVQLDLVQRGPEPTTLAVVGLSPDGSAQYSFYVEGTADRQVADPGPLASDVAALSLGTLSLVLEPGAGVYEQMLRREAARGVFTMVDPNIRADLIADADHYRARFASWLPHISVLKLSVDDAAWLADSADFSSAMQAWLAAGPQAIVLTAGGDGLTVFTSAGFTVSVPAHPVTVVDTIGAGDTVHAALLGWLASRDALSAAALAELSAQDWQLALNFAAKAAALTCAQAGAEPPYATELEW